MKNEKRSKYRRQQTIALKAIEALVDDDFMEDLMMGESRLRGRSLEMCRRLCLVYRYSHSANHHPCYYVHEGWRRQAIAAHREAGKD